MNLMIIGSNSFNNISSSYTIKLSEEESLKITKEKVYSNPHEKKIQEEKELESKKELQSDASKELSESEELFLKDLQSRDSEVRAHESAHQAAGGGMTGPASFTYQQGPDGKMYAIGGEVSISMKNGSTPQETIANARQIIAAAMAPSDPSSQDFAVASSARVMEMKAQQQLAKQEQEEVLGKEAYTDESKSQDADLNLLNISA